MDIQVAIPTYENDGRTIRFTLEGLTKQTHKDFSVLIVYKPSEGDRTLEVIDEFKRQLDIRIIYQKEGYIEEAMNLIYSNASADLLLTIDDDNIPDNNWVLDHKKYHEKYERLGVARGIVIRKNANVEGRNLFKGLIKRIIYRPYSDIFDEYSGYLTIYGIPNDRSDRSLVEIGSEYRKTITLTGANMSVKREVYKDFRLPCYTLRGFHYENILALHAIKKGYFTAEINGGFQKEIERRDYGVMKDGLSTPTTLKGKLNLIAEHFLFPYASNLLGFKPRYLRFIRTLLLFSYKGLAREAVRLGLDLAIMGIEERLEPTRIRELLKTRLENLVEGDLT